MQEVLEKQCLSPTTEDAHLQPLLQGQGSQGLEFTDAPQVGPRVLVYPSLEPHLGFLLIFEDYILGPRRRMGKDGIIWKLGVGLHYP